MEQLLHTEKSSFNTAPNRLPIIKGVLFYCLVFVCSVIYAQERIYKTPPSTSATGTVPSISDEAMKKCVEIYNEASWLQEELNNTQVDLSQPASVEAYNSQASVYSQMADYYNNNCAGKQSKLADSAAEKLNQQSN